MTGQIVVPASDSRREVMQACQRGDEGIEEMLDSWIARTPQESREILAMLELSCEDTDGEKDAKVNDKEHPYFMKNGQPTPPPVKDPAALVKELFAKLVAEGAEPNVAAARAIQMAAQQQKSGEAATMEAGPLNDIDWKSAVISTPLPEEMASRVAALNESNKDAVDTIVSTTLKYLENAKREPWNPKFRSFKLSNKIVDRITRIEGALDLLCSLGLYIFPTETDFMACIPLSADLDELETSMKKLLPTTVEA